MDILFPGVILKIKLKEFIPCCKTADYYETAGGPRLANELYQPILGDSESKNLSREKELSNLLKPKTAG